MLDDPITSLAALAGGIVGVVLMVRLGEWGGSSHESAPTLETQAQPTGYASRHHPSAAPILIAFGVAAIGIGLAVGAAGGRPALLPLIPGVLLLMAGLLSMRRGWLAGVEEAGEEDEERADLSAHQSEESGGRR